jgi:tryptophan-rich sensory protein
LLVWAAYAYALAAGRAAGSRELTLVGLNLTLPLLWTLLLLGGHILLGIVSALGWAISLLVLGVILVQREPLAGVMMLPIFGASLTASLLTLTLWLLPAPAA